MMQNVANANKRGGEVVIETVSAEYDWTETPKIKETSVFKLDTGTGVPQISMGHCSCQGYTFMVQAASSRI